LPLLQGLGHRARLHAVVDELVVLVVHYVVLVLGDDLHGREDVERVVDAALHVFEVNFI